MKTRDWFSTDVGPLRDLPSIPLVEPKEIVSFHDYITASNKYPERLSHPELTDDVRENAKAFLVTINAFLVELGIESVTVSSGFRPSSVNGTVGGAKRSAHLSGQAIDLADSDGSLDALFQSRDDLLKRHGLWLEHPDSTKSWAHLDCKNRGDRASNVFSP